MEGDAGYPRGKTFFGGGTTGGRLLPPAKTLGATRRILARRGYIPAEE